MINGMARLSIVFILCLVMTALGCLTVSAKVPEGYRDIKLGMTKSQVLDLLQKSPMHFAYDDLGPEIGEIVRGDDLFRYATYKFDKDGVLVEIGLQMREILGREKCIELYNSQNGIQLTPLKSIGDSDISIEVLENSLIMKKTGKDTRSAKGSS